MNMLDEKLGVLPISDQTLLITAPYYLIGFSPKLEGGLYIDVTLTLHMTWDCTKHYEYSKLYYNTDPEKNFDESRVICFRVERQGIAQKIRLACLKQ